MKSRCIGKWTITKPTNDGSGSYTTYETSDVAAVRAAGRRGWGISQHIEVDFGDKPEMTGEWIDDRSKEEAKQFKTVPVDPTYMMIGAGARAVLAAWEENRNLNSLDTVKVAYAAMLDAYASPAIDAAPDNSQAVALSAEQERVELVRDYIELNPSNYNADDISALNAWAVRAIDFIEWRAAPRQHERRAEGASMTKIIGLANRCTECPNRRYYSAGSYECTKVRGPEYLRADGTIPDWCPLPDYRATPSAENRPAQDDVDGPAITANVHRNAERWRMALRLDYLPSTWIEHIDAAIASQSAKEPR